MKKTVFALAATAALGFAGAAFAGDATPGAWSTSTATAPTAMSDSDMDKVTAGATGGEPGANLTFGNQNGCGGPGLDSCAGGLAGGNDANKVHPSAP